MTKSCTRVEMVVGLSIVSVEAQVAVETSKAVLYVSLSLTTACFAAFYISCSVGAIKGYVQ